VVAVVFRKRISAILSEALGYSPVPLTSDSFEQDIEDGLTSSTFDVTQNLADGDTRPGLASEEIRRIMKKRGVSFDRARLIRQEQMLRENVSIFVTVVMARVLDRGRSASVSNENSAPFFFAGD